MTEKIVRVGVGVLILNDKNEFLMGKRKSSHGIGTWALVGGHVDFGETLEDCAKREALEETGLVIDNVKVMTASSHFFDDNTKHYVSIYMIGRIAGGELKNMEPHKVESWQFHDDWNNLPSPRFVPYDRDITPEMIQSYIMAI